MPVSVVIADVDGDERLDLAAALQDEDRVAVRRQLADGTFAPRVAARAEGFPWALAWFEPRPGQGLLAVSLAGAGRVAFYRWGREGNLVSFGSVGGMRRPGPLLACDLDGDGRQGELLVGDLDAHALLAIVPPGGGEGPPVLRRVLEGISPDVFLVEDVDADGSADAIVLDLLERTMERIRGPLLREGWVPDAARRQIRRFEELPRDLLLADVTGDGRRDLLVATGARTLEVGRRVADGREPGGAIFEPLARLRLPGQAGRLAGGDLDGDGVDEIFAADPRAFAVRVLRGTTGEEVREALFVGSDPKDLRVRDVDGDEALDVVVTNQAGDAVIQRGDGQGDFVRSLRLAVGSHPLDLAAGDVDGDGRIDLVTADASADRLSILRGTKEGGFLPARPRKVPRGPQGVSLADLDGDGIPEILVVSADDNRLSILPAREGSAAPRELPAGRFAGQVVAADLDGDGDVDLVVPSRLDDAALVWRNDGTGGLDRLDPIALAEQPIRVVVWDGEGDGRVDLAFAHAGAPVVSIVRGEADLHFTPPRLLDLPHPASDVAAGDWDGDGLVDLAAPMAKGGSVALWAGSEEGGWLPLPGVPAGVSPHAALAGDWDGDGRDDLWVTARESHQLLLLLGGSRGLHLSYGLGTRASPQAVVAADLNGDGAGDVATADAFSAGVSIFLRLEASASGGS